MSTRAPHVDTRGSEREQEDARSRRGRNLAGAMLGVSLLGALATRLLAPDHAPSADAPRRDLPSVDAPNSTPATKSAPQRTSADLPSPPAEPATEPLQSLERPAAVASTPIPVSEARAPFGPAPDPNRGLPAPAQPAPPAPSSAPQNGAAPKRTPVWATRIATQPIAKLAQTGMALHPGAAEQRATPPATAPVTSAAGSADDEGRRTETGRGREDSEANGVTESAATAQAEPGYLSLDSAPWSEVFLAGRLLGITPLRRVPLPPGKHLLTLRNPELGTSTSYVVDIKSGATLARLVGWK